MSEQSKIRQSFLIYLVRWSNKCNGKKGKLVFCKHQPMLTEIKKNLRKTKYRVIQKYFVHLNLGRFVLYKHFRFWCTGGSPPEAFRVYITYICQQYTLTSAAKRPFKTNSRNTSFLFYFTTLACPCCFPHCFNSL